MTVGPSVSAIRFPDELCYNETCEPNYGWGEQDRVSPTDTMLMSTATSLRSAVTQTGH